MVAVAYGGQCQQGGLLLSTVSMENAKGESPSYDTCENVERRVCFLNVGEATTTHHT